MPPASMIERMKPEQLSRCARTVGPQWREDYPGLCYCRCDRSRLKHQCEGVLLWGRETRPPVALRSSPELSWDLTHILWKMDSDRGTSRRLLYDLRDGVQQDFVKSKSRHVAKHSHQPTHTYTVFYHPFHIIGNFDKPQSRVSKIHSIKFSKPVTVVYMRAKKKGEDLAEDRKARSV